MEDALPASATIKLFETQLLTSPVGLSCLQSFQCPYELDFFLSLPVFKPLLSSHFFTMTTPLQVAQECLVPPSYVAIVAQATSSEPQFRLLPDQSFSLSSLLSC